MSPFKSCDIRGVYPEEVDEALAHNLGRALAALAHPGAVAVAGDVRPSTAPLKKALVEGLMAGGRRVLDLGTLPTPAYYFEMERLGVKAGVMVTGSHNHPSYNGFKPRLTCFPISQADLTRLEILSARRWEACGTGCCVRVGGPEAYMEALVQRFRGLPPIRVVIDAGNGTMSEIAPRVFRRVGCDTVELFCEPDGAFPNRLPNPSEPANLVEISKTVVSRSADLGIAFDGDGDRVVFLTADGVPVVSDQMLALVAEELLRGESGGVVVHDLKCSRVVPDVVRRAGGIPVWERSGHAWMRTRMQREGAVFGGEVSGHYFFRELAGGDDGLFAALLVVSYLTRWGDLRARLDTLPKYRTLPEIRIPCLADRKTIVERLKEALDGSASLIVADGVRADWEDGWGIVRASVTEPMLAMRFEGKSVDALRRCAETMLQHLPQSLRSEATEALEQHLQSLDETA